MISQRNFSTLLYISYHISMLVCFVFLNFSDSGAIDSCLLRNGDVF